ncbi:MAG TPA: 50S ribosomal protein L11 methyltransferase [Roseiflexaceae bacterium]|nr:50S ribosomal protein L11 methyltransferase [Roseiflexaceae bacterium]
MTWLELSVDVDQEAVESVSELLAQYGYNGGVAVDQPIIPGADGPEYSFDTSRPVTVRTYLPLDDQAEEIRQRIEQALWHFGQMRAVGPLSVRPLEEEDWANAWKQHYTIQRIGARTVIVPSWLEYQPGPDDLVLRLDPGMAFGTGLHPTTQLCVGFVEQYVKPGMQVLDLGCGSGILAITAARLGATVLALDTDPIAVTATRENVARNELDRQASVAEGSLGAGAALGHWLGWEAERSDVQTFKRSNVQFDVIVANIIARVLAALARDMADALAPNATLIASGIIADREHEVVEAFVQAGLVQTERRQEGDWVALVYQKRSRE